MTNLLLLAPSLLLLVLRAAHESMQGMLAALQCVSCDYLLHSDLVQVD
jgi:hypothetical protein